MTWDIPCEVLTTLFAKRLLLCSTVLKPFHCFNVLFFHYFIQKEAYENGVSHHFSYFHQMTFQQNSVIHYFLVLSNTTVVTKKTNIISKQPSSQPWLNTKLKLVHLIPVPSPRAGFGGLSSPPNQAPSPPNWNTKHYKLREFLSNLNVKPALHERKAPLLTAFSRRFCLIPWHRSCLTCIIFYRWYLRLQYNLGTRALCNWRLKCVMYQMFVLLK